MAVERSVDLDDMVVQLNHWKKEIAGLKSQASQSKDDNLKEICSKIGELQRIIEVMKKKAVTLRWQHVKRLISCCIIRSRDSIPAQTALCKNMAKILKRSLITPVKNYHFRS